MYLNQLLFFKTLFETGQKQNDIIVFLKTIFQKSFFKNSSGLADPEWIFFEKKKFTPDQLNRYDSKGVLPIAAPGDAAAAPTLRAYQREGDRCEL